MKIKKIYYQQYQIPLSKNFENSKNKYNNQKGVNCCRDKWIEDNPH